MKPSLRALGASAIGIEPERLGMTRMYVEGGAELLFTDNESNAERLWNFAPTGYCKDGFHERIVHGRQDRVNPAQIGTKAAAWHRGGRRARRDRPNARVRLCRRPREAPFGDFEQCAAARRPRPTRSMPACRRASASADERNIQRQAFAGMIWNKQFYHFDVRAGWRAIPGRPRRPRAASTGATARGRNINNADIISMPDKWEYPWYASWDLAFHCISFALIDAEFAKHQLVLLTREWYMHPNGQIPAYEWAFGDVNPPVHAWAAWRVYQIDRKQNGGTGDLEFLERVFHKLMLNFTWWVNRKDKRGHATSSRADSWASTTSACSTAAPSCPPADTSTSRTAPAGWRCMRST